MTELIIETALASAEHRKCTVCPVAVPSISTELYRVQASCI